MASHGTLPHQTPRAGEPLPLGRAGDLNTWRGTIAHIAHHNDATVRQACEMLLTFSPDHCDQVTAKQLLEVIP